MLTFGRLLTSALRSTSTSTFNVNKSYNALSRIRFRSEKLVLLSSYPVHQNTQRRLLRTRGGEGETSSAGESGTASSSSLEESGEDELYSEIILHMKSPERKVLNNYVAFIGMTASELKVTVNKVVAPPILISRRTLLKSKFAHKDHRVQYEYRNYIREVHLVKLTGSTASTILEYLERNLPEAVSLRVDKCRIERMPSHIIQDIEEREVVISSEGAKKEDDVNALQLLLDKGMQTPPRYLFPKKRIIEKMYTD